MKRLSEIASNAPLMKGYQLEPCRPLQGKLPLLTGLARSKWLEGWREGRNDWREGLTDALTCYKLSGF
ncbi:MAG: hypothetical protein CM15mP103_04710 [Gammaproteobacteria bacterium]|nr:MAG: hypothetical protein CM15mP103_04710 [Gammaproteobacteria bacterium]